MKKLLGTTITYLLFTGILFLSANNISADSPSKTETFKFLKDKTMTLNNCRAIVGGDGWCDVKFEIELDGNTLITRGYIVKCNDGSESSPNSPNTWEVNLSELDPTRVKFVQKYPDIPVIHAYCTGDKKCAHNSSYAPAYKKRVHYNYEYLVVNLDCCGCTNQDPADKVARSLRHLIRLSGGQEELF